MTVFHGNCTSNFKLNAWQNSRYGIKAIFASTNIELARLYAAHHAKEAFKREGGFVYKFDIAPNHQRTIDYGGKSSYSSEYRKLIFTYSKKTDVLLIKNVIDYPHQSLRHFLPSDIVVIFNPTTIREVMLVEQNVTQPHGSY